MSIIFSILLLLVFIYFSYRASPRERAEDAHIHGAGQIGMLGALALFGVDYATSYFYATGEMMSALHPYGLQQYSYIVVGVIAFANLAFGALYMYSLGIFNEGGGSYTASMRYLWPSLSLIVAVMLLQDYVLTIVVSSLSGGDQLLSVLNAYDAHWIWHFLIGAVLAGITWYLTIRGRGESAQIVFTLMGIFVMMTVTMGIGLFLAHVKGMPPVEAIEPIKNASIGQALFHMLTASMKGMVALTGLEAMSNGIQFVKNEDAGLVKWGKKHLPRMQGVWHFYSGKAGIGRLVQTSFLFYGGLTTLFLTVFSLRFNVFDGTFGRTLVGNLAFIGFEQVPGGIILFWVYQFLAVALLSAASMTAFQDLQSTEWRDVAIGELPEIIVYRNAQGTFTRSVTAGFIATVIIQFLVRGNTSMAVPFYGVGVFMPITVMGLAIRRHIQRHSTGRKRTWGMLAATLVTILAASIFIGQIVGKWQEGGWVVLISFTILILVAHLILLSPAGYRDAAQIRRIIFEKAKVRGSMATIVEWQALRMQEYRYSLVQRVAYQTARFFELFGVRRPIRYEPVPAVAGEYDEALHIDHPHDHPAHSQEDKPVAEPQVGGKPNETSRDEP